MLRYNICEIIFTMRLIPQGCVTYITDVLAGLKPRVGTWASLNLWVPNRELVVEQKQSPNCQNHGMGHECKVHSPHTRTRQSKVHLQHQLNCVCFAILI